MILIADSGSTKTDWCLIDEQKITHHYSTQGINPYFQSVEQIAEIIKLELLPQLSTYNFQFFSMVQVVGPILKKKLYGKH